MAFLGGSTNSFRDQDVRRALAPLAGLAERLGSAEVIVRHLNKNSSERNALYRGGASIAFIGAARSGLLVARNPDDESGESRILASTKANLGRLPRSLGYSIQPHGDSICVSWTGESSHRADDLLAMPDSQEELTLVEEAASFLKSILEDGALEANKAIAKAKAAGFTEKTIQRARRTAGVKPYRRGFGAGSNWMLHIPPNMAEESVKAAKGR